MSSGESSAGGAVCGSLIEDYSVCAEALRLDGQKVANNTMINHPALGGQKLFRAKLRGVLSDVGHLI